MTFADWLSEDLDQKTYDACNGKFLEKIRLLYNSYTYKLAVFDKYVNKMVLSEFENQITEELFRPETPGVVNVTILDNVKDDELESLYSCYECPECGNDCVTSHHNFCHDCGVDLRED